MDTPSRIFVKGLPPNMTVHDFREHFSKQAPITDAKFIPHRRIGYVGFRTPEDAANAVRYHNRSFIRMSKIGVELARSVEEQQKNHRAHKFGTKALQKPPMNADGRHYMDEESIDAGAPATKKRRLSAEKAKRNGKLQEFLQVMQPPSKVRNWNSQGLFAGDSELVASAERQEPAEVGIDNQKNDQYEYVPTNQQDFVEEPNETSKKVLEDASPAGNDPQNVENPERLEAEEKAYPQDTFAAPAVDDEDWLRSRTNRVLGLVGEEDDFAKIPQSKGQEALHDEVDDGKPLRQDHEAESKKVRQAEDEEIPPLAKHASLDTEEHELSNGRLFLRNLTYTCTEDDIRGYVEAQKLGGVVEIHLPLDLRTDKGYNKGFAYVQFADHQTALRALDELDQRPFQGRLLHVLSARSKPPDALDEFAISKLPHKQQQRIRRKAEASSLTFNWNSMYMSTDAVLSSVSDRLGVSKSELLDPTSSDAAVKQAHAETHVLQETQSYFTANGVDLGSFKTKVRSSTAILVKNFPYGTKLDELKHLFDTYGPLKRLLMPSSGTIAIVEFEQGDHARSAFGNLSYSKFKDSILFLEKAPKNLFTTDSQADAGHETNVREAKPSTTELLGDDPMNHLDTSTLFVRNLNFSTTNERLQEAFKSLDGFRSSRIKTKPDPKKPGATLSMGYGFLEFRSKTQAQAALTAMDGYKLDGYALLVRASHRGVDAAEERRDADKTKKVAERRTKIIIKNLPFEVTKKDVRSLFGAYGQVRSVRVPKKFDSSTRGFAFVDFITAREAENAMDALKDTHFLGRRLVLQFTAEEEVDPEAVIQQMQKKVGKQVDKVALQKLTGTGRQKFNVADKADGLDQLVED